MESIINWTKGIYYRLIALMIYGPYVPDQPTQRTKSIYSTESEKFFEV